MRHLLLLALACFLSSLQPLLAQSSTDPGDLFVNAYMAVQQAEKAEQAGDLRAAQTKFRYASETLETIAAKFPTWRPEIVTYRKQRTAEALTRVQGKVTKFGPGNPAPVEGGLDENKPESQPGTLIPGEDIFAAPPDVPEPAPVPPKRGKTPSRPTEAPDSTADLEGAISRMKKLQADLKAAHAATDQAEAEKKELQRKYDDATQAREKSEKEQKKLQTQAELAGDALLKAQSERKVDADKIKALQLAVTEAKKGVKGMEISRAADEEVRRQYEDRVQAAQAKTATLTEQRNALEKANKDVPLKVRELEQQLTKVQAENKDLKTQIVTIKGERDEAMKQLVELKESAKNVEKLVADNSALMAKLTAAQQQVANFKAEGEEKDRQIAALKKEVGSVQEQLAQVRAESAKYLSQMGDMRTKLEEQGRQLARVKSENAASVAERKRMQSENETLRGIVLRQQKQEAQRAATKKLVLGELAKLEINSQTLLQEIEFLSQPVVRLSEREKALFKKPAKLEISDDEISAFLPKPRAPTTAANGPKDPPAIEPKTPEIVVPPKTEPTPPEIAKGPEPLPTKDPAMELALNKPAISVIPTPEKPEEPPPLTSNGNEPADKGTIGAVAGQPNIPSEYLPLARDGKDLFEKGDYRGAEKIYEKILAKVPKNLYILSNLGVVRFRAGKLKAAEEVLIKATTIAPEDGFSHCTLGIVYFTEQKYDEAVSSLTKALAINPKNPTAHNYLGITAASKGWQEAAQKELETATTLDPSYADAHFNLAVVFATQTPPNKDSARKFYKRATELGAEPDSSLEQMIK